MSPAAAPTWLCGEDQTFMGLLGVDGRDAGTLYIRSHPDSLITECALLYVYFNCKEPLTEHAPGVIGNPSTEQANMGTVGRK